MKYSRLKLAALCATVILAGCGGGGDATVQLSGTAYRFNATSIKLAGATVAIAEIPGLSAVTDSNGLYTLNVPAGKSVTPYITAPGYRSIYLQTFTPNANLTNVNFQTPDMSTFFGLYLLLTNISGGTVPDKTGCVIVSTVSDARIQGLSFSQFVGFGAHGVAGATGTSTPALPSPVYFNERVTPDPAQLTTSKDGGMVWTNVPVGTYTISATHPTRKFASFTATCEMGRIVNANPPWGVSEQL